MNEPSIGLVSGALCTLKGVIHWPQTVGLLAMRSEQALSRVGVDFMN